MTNIQTSNLSFKSLWKFFKDCIKFHYAGFPTWSIFLVLFLLSILAGIRFESANSIFMAGEFATENVIADRTLKVIDEHATAIRREQTRELQPLIFDLQRNKIHDFTESIKYLLQELSEYTYLSDTDSVSISETSKTDVKSLAKVQKEFNSHYNTNFDEDFFKTLTKKELQKHILTVLLPFSEILLTEGIFSNRSTNNTTASSILIRDSEKGKDTLVTQSSNLPTITSLHTIIAHEIASSQFSLYEKSCMAKLIESLAPVTLVYNNEATTIRTNSIVNAIPTVFYFIQKGELIVSIGEFVTREQQLKMQALYRFSSGKLDLIKVFGVFALGVFITLAFFISPTNSAGNLLDAKVQLFIALLLFTFGLLALFSYWFIQANFKEYIDLWVYAFPIAGATALSSLIFSARRFYSIGFLLSFFATVFLQGNLSLFLFFFLSSMFNTLLITRTQNRQDVVRSAIPLLFMQIFLGCTSAFYNLNEINQFYELIIAIIINTIFSLVVVFIFGPIIEMGLGLTTRFRLMELMNFEHALLQELMIKTPGTYHHSIVVSNLVEAGANAVKANALLAKVGALYHDIGKIGRPEYFVENQSNGINKHDLLAPAMSALIIISHVKQGVELAEEYKLGKEITDIIAEHHGNRCVSYFYHKALEAHTGEGDPPSESSFAYPYSRPQSKEAALVMLADAIEASSRTLSEPTPARIESHVNKIVQGIYSEGQLDESDLTFKDLNLVSAAFVRVLTGLFHQRIVYPEKKK